MMPWKKRADKLREELESAQATRNEVNSKWPEVTRTNDLLWKHINKNGFTDAITTIARGGRA